MASKDTRKCSSHEDVAEETPTDTLLRRDPGAVVEAVCQVHATRLCSSRSGWPSLTNKPSRVQHVAWSMSAKLVLYRNELASLHCSYRLSALTIAINRPYHTAITPPLLYRRASSTRTTQDTPRYTRSSRRCTCGTASHMALLHIATPQTPSIGPLTATPLLKLPDLHLARPLHRPSTKHHVYNVLLSCYLRVLLFARCS